MPRKKSVGGRKRTDLTTNYLLERANKKLVNLERANLSGKYASRELIRSLQGNKAVKVGSRKARNRIKVIRSLNIREKKFVNKKLREFVQSDTSTPTGIKRKRAETRDNVLQGLSKLVDRELTKEDLDDFYDLIENEDFQGLADKIGDSEMYVLVDEAKQKNISNPNDFVKLLNKHMTSNTKEVRDKATRLFNKYVK